MRGEGEGGSHASSAPSLITVVARSYPSKFDFFREETGNDLKKLQKSNPKLLPKPNPITKP